MAAKKTPVTPDMLMAEVRSVKGIVINQGKTIKQNSADIAELQEKNRVDDAVAKGVQKYIEGQDRQAVRDFGKTKIKVARELIPLIMAATALVYALLTRYH